MKQKTMTRHTPDSGFVQPGKPEETNPEGSPKAPETVSYIVMPLSGGGGGHLAVTLGKSVPSLTSVTPSCLLHLVSG